VTESNAFIISRVFDAPRDLLYKAWTIPELMAKWWGPKGFTVQISKLDLRPGGVYHYCLHAPDGKAMWGKFTYREVVAPEKLVFVNCFSNEKGGMTRHPLSANWPLEMLSTITFAPAEGGTKLTIKWEALNATDVECQTFNSSFKDMEQGWGGTLDQLAAFLKR